MNLVELEARRKEAAKALGVRYCKLTKKQALEALVKLNAPKEKLSYPFPQRG